MPAISAAQLLPGRWVVYRPDPALPLWHCGRVGAVRGETVAVREPFTVTPGGRVRPSIYPSATVHIAQVEGVLDHRPSPEEVLALARKAVA